MAWKTRARERSISNIEGGKKQKVKQQLAKEAERLKHEIRSGPPRALPRGASIGTGWMQRHGLEWMKPGIGTLHKPLDTSPGRWQESGREGKG